MKFPWSWRNSRKLFVSYNPTTTQSLSFNSPCNPPLPVVAFHFQTLSDMKGGDSVTPFGTPSLQPHFLGAGTYLFSLVPGRLSFQSSATPPKIWVSLVPCSLCSSEPSFCVDIHSSLYPAASVPYSVLSFLTELPPALRDTMRVAGIGRK